MTYVSGYLSHPDPLLEKPIRLHKKASGIKYYSNLTGWNFRLSLTICFVIAMGDLSVELRYNEKPV